MEVQAMTALFVAVSVPVRVVEAGGLLTVAVKVMLSGPSAGE
jgi:hypothetical protein